MGDKKGQETSRRVSKRPRNAVQYNLNIKLPKAKRDVEVLYSETFNQFEIEKEIEIEKCSEIKRVAIDSSEDTSNETDCHKSDGTEHTQSSTLHPPFLPSTSQNIGPIGHEQSPTIRLPTNEPCQQMVMDLTEATPNIDDSEDTTLQDPNISSSSEGSLDNTQTNEENDKMLLEETLKLKLKEIVDKKAVELKAIRKKHAAILKAKMKGIEEEKAEKIKEIEEVKLIELTAIKETNAALLNAKLAEIEEEKAEEIKEIEEVKLIELTAIKETNAALLNAKLAEINLKAKCEAKYLQQNYKKRQNTQDDEHH